MPAKATNAEHRAFWAPDEIEERITLIAEIAANVREDAAPEPAELDTIYDGKARGAELLIAEFVGTRGLIKSATAAGGAKVDFDTREEALALARASMGTYAKVAPSVPSGSVAYFGPAPF